MKTSNENVAFSVTDFRHIFSKNRNIASSYHVAPLYAWSHVYAYTVEEIEGITCVYAEDAMGRYMALPPLGRSADGHVIKKCFDRMYHSPVARIENADYRLVASLDQDCYKPYLKGYEYIYWRKNLVDFSGSRKKSRRGEWNQFTKNHAYRFLSYDDSMFDACAELYRSWLSVQAEGADGISRHMAEENQIVHQRVIRCFRELGLIGRVLEINNKICAYTFGYALNDDAFCVLFEIADPAVKGAATAIFRHFMMDDDVQKFSFINTMDDTGLPGLRHAKFSFRPAVLWPLYTISLK